MIKSRTIKAAFLASGKLLADSALILTSVFLTRILTKIDYATFKQTMLVYNFTAPLLALGLPMSLYYFLPRNLKKSRSIISGNLMILFFMGLLFTAVICSGGNNLIAKRFNNLSLSNLLLLFSPYPICALLIRSLDACLLTFDKVKLLAIYHVASRIIVLILVVILVLFFPSAFGAILGMVISEAVLCFIALFLMYRFASGEKVFPERSNILEQLKYSVPLGISQLIGNISKGLDKILVSSFFSPETFAIFVNGAVEIPLADVITGSTMSILIPEFTVMYKAGKNEEILTLWHNAMKKCALLIFPITCFFFILAPEVMRVLFSAIYSESSVTFRIYLLLLPLRITQFSPIFLASANNSLIFYDTIINLLSNFILSVTLIKIIGYNGASLATVIVMYFWSLPYYLFFISKILKVNYIRIFPLGKLANIFLISLFTSSILFLKYFTNASDFIKVIILGTMYALALMTIYWKKGWMTFENKKFRIVV